MMNRKELFSLVSNGVNKISRIAARGAALAAVAVSAALSFAATVYAGSDGSFGGGFQNPLQTPDIQSFIATGLKALVVIALPIITVFIVISGFMFVAARGNQSKLDKAKENFVYVIIGAMLILGAWVLATLIGGTVTQVLGQ